MSDDIAIKVEGVSKSFRLPHEKNSSVKNSVVNFYKRRRTFEKQEALKDVSFEIKKGEFFGIVGRNGSGKSTILKLLAGIYSPSKGNIMVNGKVTPFIELGVGFNPELTGRENVYLNGALLGFSRKEMNAMYDKIVEFAELERFMDQKLKNYSSGMQVRLAFSIAIQAESEILILDEVLAVGDESFQRKCIKVFDDYKKNRQTVVLVTHDMATVKKYCSKAVLIHDGEVIEAGSPHEVANKYSKLNLMARSEGRPVFDSDIDLKILNYKKPDDPAYVYGEKMQVKLTWPKHKKVDYAGVAIYTSTGECAYATNTDLDKFSLDGKNSVTYNVTLNLGEGNYLLRAGTFLGSDHQVVDYISEGPNFSMGKEDSLIGEGVARLPHNWDLKDV